MRNILLLILFVLFLPVVVNADELISNRGEFNSNFIDAHEAALRLPRLHSLLISYRGELVFEEYYNGADPRRPANMKSASKSVISALIGIAIDEGHIKSVEDPITKYFPEYILNQTDPDKQLITIENLLTMQSGLETTSNRNYGKWVLSENWVEFVLNQPLVAKPGTRMLYSTGSTHLLSAILTRASGINTKEFAQKHLTSQLGYSMSYWSRDPQGIYFGGNDMEMTPRQMLAFGELYLNKGVHEGRQIIPTNWVKQSYRPHVLSPRGQGRYYGLLNRDYGTKVVAGTNPKKAGTDVEGIPIFASVTEAVEETGATASCIFIPAPGVRSAVLEAAQGGVDFIVAITEGVPAHDEALFYNQLRKDFPNVQLLGPNCPGIISPGECNIGITAGHIALPGGPVGIVSRSGTLTYQALHELKEKGIGCTTCVGIGGDPVPGTSFIDCLAAFEADPETKAVMMIGEIGGSAEEEAAEFISNNMTKPISAYIAGVTAPPGKKMGHAGAIVSGGKGTAKAKMEALEEAGVKVGNNPTEAGDLMAEIVSQL